MVLKLLDTQKVILFSENILIEGLVDTHLVSSLVVNGFLALLDVLVDSFKCRLDVTTEELFLLLVLALLVGVVDLIQILSFLAEQPLSFLNCIIQIDVFSVLFGL